MKLVSSELRMTPIGDIPRIKKLEVIGVFESGISGYDEVLAFIDYRLLQKIFRMNENITGLGVRISNPENAPEIAHEFAELTDEYIIRNWADENKSIFQVMKLEKIGLFLILTLIIVVAAFNIISGLTILIKNKTKEIAILKTFSHFLFVQVPFLLSIPIACILLNIANDKLFYLFASFGIGSLILSCLGSISSSMNLMNQRNFLLGSVIVMIFSVPIIIFSVGIINMEESFNSLINILFGILLIVFAINPWASGLCLKLSLENN